MTVVCSQYQYLRIITGNVSLLLIMLPIQILFRARQQITIPAKEPKPKKERLKVIAEMPVSISGLVTYFTNKVKNFTGSCLATHYKEWETLTSDVEILNTVKELSLEFQRSPPENSSSPKHQNFSHQESRSLF